MIQVIVFSGDTAIQDANKFFVKHGIERNMIVDMDTGINLIEFEGRPCADYRLTILLDVPIAIQEEEIPSGQ